MTDLDRAIQFWKDAARRERLFGLSVSAVVCENAARELEILRDTGETVYINKRTS